MGKRLIQQARGKGSPTYRAPSFRYVSDAKHSKYTGVKGEVIDLVHCPGHSSPLAKIKYQNGDLNYCIAAEGIKVGDFIETSNTAKVDRGNTLTLQNIPEGTLIYNIESKPGDGGKFVRASGTFAKILGRLQNNVIVLLPSKKTKDFNYLCRATIGVVAGGGRTEKPFFKAGNKYHASRARNKLYPKISGTSQNAVDHPFGGTTSSKKGRPTTAPKHAPPGRKVGMIRPRKSGRGKRQE